MPETDDDVDGEPQEGDVEPAGPDDPEGPDLGEDDMVDVDEEMAAAVAESTSSDDDERESTSNDGNESESSSTSSSESSPSPTETLTTGTSVGDMYCNALGMGATLARQRKGSGVEDRDAAMDEYGDLARQMDLDKFVNEWVEEHGAADELTPGQGIAIGTGMFAMTVLVEDPQIVENLQEDDT